MHTLVVARLAADTPWSSYKSKHCWWVLKPLSERERVIFGEQGDAREMGDAAGTTVDGRVKHASRMLRSTVQHLSGPYQLTPRPRGSFNSLVARALPVLTPGPDEVFHILNYQCLT